MEMKLRPMAAGDKAAIMKILRATPEFLPAEVLVAEEVIDAFLEGPESGYSVVVAEVQGDIAGYVCYGATPLTLGTWDIYWIAVAREHQRKGIGRAMLSVTETSIIQAGGRLALIETSSKPDYDKTRSFYGSEGYRVVCRIPDFYAPGDDKLVLEKRFR